jgi:hypothetical protein
MAAFVRTEHPGGTYLYTWTLTTADHTGDPVQHPGGADKTVQFTTDAAGSATIIMEGALHSGEYIGLVDPQGNAISATATGKLEAVLENTLLIRPRLSVPGTAAEWTAYLFVRSTMR